MLSLSVIQNKVFDKINFENMDEYKYRIIKEEFLEFDSTSKDSIRSQSSFNKQESSDTEDCQTENHSEELPSVERRPNLEMKSNYLLKISEKAEFRQKVKLNSLKSNKLASSLLQVGSSSQNASRRKLSSKSSSPNPRLTSSHRQESIVKSNRKSKQRKVIKKGEQNIFIKTSNGFKKKLVVKSIAFTNNEDSDTSSDEVEQVAKLSEHTK
eukprot:CAMPEP_0168339442 /NCGR_PEP_ID=MMETSP0213-20121227/13456_1 /TAXON_ID=151035 /ORGANISM="Euplotes harpa, Strain FSP1.4" /LENGTH=210 /DNA_ID=CAMNT_0008345459 /DNA_START=1010 /DNA_END=1642 /DNA_ORIENTATION=-